MTKLLSTVAAVALSLGVAAGSANAAPANVTSFKQAEKSQVANAYCFYRTYYFYDYYGNLYYRTYYYCY
jgi:hypothetical protein